MNRTAVTNQTTGYTEPTALFWALLVFYLCIAVVGIIGNCLVIYASYGNKNSGPLRYLDDVVKSLAVTDMLFGVVGAPCIIFIYYMGEL